MHSTHFWKNQGEQARKESLLLKNSLKEGVNEGSLGDLGNEGNPRASIFKACGATTAFHQQKLLLKSQDPHEQSEASRFP